MRQKEIARAALWTALSAYVLSFMEWLFFSTMPSVLSRMDAIGKLQVLATTSLWLAIVSLACFSPLALLAQLFGARTCRLILALVPALIVTALAILMADNFFTTVIKTGIAQSKGIGVALYAAAGIGISLRTVTWFASSIRVRGSWLPAVTGTLMVSSSCVVLLRLSNSTPPPTSVNTEKAADSKVFPHIFLVGVDGIEATHTSFYGYERPTTPTLDALRSDLLYAENALSCAGNSRTAITGMLTGKFPLRTGVFMRGALAGSDSFEHLPGILKSLGYTNFQFGSHYFIDSEEANMQSAFDEINGRQVSEPWRRWIPRSLAARFSADIFLGSTIIYRIRERVSHLAGRKPMTDIVASVTRNARHVSDEQRLDSLIHFLERTEGPVFAHLHLMGTHCCDFSPEVNTFWHPGMSGKEELISRYDATILESDARIARLLGYLRERGLDEDSLFIYYSDHGRGWRPNFRIPLMFRFPHGKHAKNIRNVVSLLDVAPTVLHYLDQRIPSWMDGVSILSSDFEDMKRKHFAVLEKPTLRASGHLAGIPPLLQTSAIQGLVYFECNHWYEWHRPTDRITSGILDGYTASCDRSAPLTLAETADIIAERLATHNLLKRRRPRGP